MHVETQIVQTQASSYPIMIGEAMLDHLEEWIAPYCAGQKVFIVTDETVAPLYLNAVQHAFKKTGKVVYHSILPAGEATKSFAAFQALSEEILAILPDRKTTLVALGGGVIGDLTGFAASVLVRGVPFIQIPTTLLAQVDSSVGGKTAINCDAGKNLIGSFYQPVAVFMDVATLETLPMRELLAGYGEVIKYGLLGDVAFYEKLLENAPCLLQRDKSYLCEIIRHCCQMKAEIVAEDEKEQGKRALLNLGHTFAHAIEKHLHYDGRILHGEAVALGCLMAMSLSENISQGEIERLKAHYGEIGLPCQLSEIDATVTWNAKMLTNYCYQDKKALDGKLTFIMLKEIGEATVSNSIQRGVVEKIFTQYA
jgi:3-dehydroquinate synthase